MISSAILLVYSGVKSSFVKCKFGHLFNKMTKEEPATHQTHELLIADCAL